MKNGIIEGAKDALAFAQGDTSRGVQHSPQIDIAALVADLTTKSAMINMGEKIAWGSETALMDQAAAALIAQDAELKRLREALETIRDKRGQCNRAVDCRAVARTALGEKP